MVAPSALFADCGFRGRGGLATEVAGDEDWERRLGRRRRRREGGLVVEDDDFLTGTCTQLQLTSSPPPSSLYNGRLRFQTNPRQVPLSHGQPAFIHPHQLLERQQHIPRSIRQCGLQQRRLPASQELHPRRSLSGHHLPGNRADFHADRPNLILSPHSGYA